MLQSSYGNPGGEAHRKYQELVNELERLHNNRTPLKKFLAAILNVDAEEKRKAESWRKGALGELEIGHLLDQIASSHGSLSQLKSMAY